MGYGVSKQVASHLPSVYFTTRQTGTIWTPSRWIDKLKIRLTKKNKYPFLKDAEIFALESGFVAPLIGHRNYFLLSDGPNCMTYHMQENSSEYQRQQKKLHSIVGRLEAFLYGTPSVLSFGNNPQCKGFYMTEENISPVFGDRPVWIKSLQSMWENASDAKKNLVMKVFDVSDDDIARLNGKKFMFLTQPMLKDRILDEDEYVEILKAIFSKYDHSQLLLKLHPRDNFDYKRYFPDVEIYDKNVGMQLLILLGADVSRAITICSSSVNAFPETVEVDWFGVDVHPKVKEYFGENALPSRKFNLMK